MMSMWQSVAIMSRHQNHTPLGAVFTDLVLEVFRLNGQLLVAGDQMTRGAGLTSARWQVLGAVEIAGYPLTVAQIGRRMGLSRQAVQRVANDLRKQGFVTFEENPDHKRASLITLTGRGKEALAEMGNVQANWANGLADGMDPARLAAALCVLQELQKRCETTRNVPKPVNENNP